MGVNLYNDRDQPVGFADLLAYRQTVVKLLLGNYSGGSCFPATLLAESLCIFSDLAVGETPK
jgi:hypothetical protein